MIQVLSKIFIAMTVESLAATELKKR